jgi:DNA-binding transcriptional LysR family regulator
LGIAENAESVDRKEMPMSTLRFLRTIVAIAEHGSFAAAAERVELTHAAVGQQMRALESEIGRPLFNREKRSITLRLAV